MRWIVSVASVLAFVSGGCIQPSDPVEGPFHDGTPMLQGLSLVCEQATASWRLEAETDAWTGGGTLYLTRDGREVEQHRVGSARAAGDGTWDCLEATLGQSVDRRDHVPGSITRWLCREADELSYLFVVVDPTGGDQTDCLAWGAEPSIWDAVEGVPRCPPAAADEEGLVLEGFSACG